VNDATVDGRAWQRFGPPCVAAVRFLQREPRRCVLQDAAEIEVRQRCSLVGVTCFSSIFILVGAAMALGVSFGLGVDAIAKAAGAGTFVILIGAVLVLVCRALSMKVHAVICCLSGVAACTEFSNVTVNDSPLAQVVIVPAQPVIAHAVAFPDSAVQYPQMAIAQPVVPPLGLAQAMPSSSLPLPV